MLNKLNFFDLETIKTFGGFINMGFFSLKQVCSICGNDCGLNRYQIKDKGWCCPKCFKKAGLTMMSPIKTMSAETIKGMIAKKEESLQELKSLTITKDFGAYIKFDENNRKWFVPDGTFGGVKNPVIYSFDDIIAFELLEDGNSITKGGTGRAIAGGLLFGGVGAIVGGSAGKRKTKSTCTKLQIKITVNSMSTPAVYINLIAGETKTDGFIYKTAYSSAQNILSVLQVICENNKTLHETMPDSTVSTSSADEIVKYKNLLDQGIITQEEFDAKKKQLLGL